MRTNAYCVTRDGYVHYDCLTREDKQDGLKLRTGPVVGTCARCGKPIKVAHEVREDTP